MHIAQALSTCRKYGQLVRRSQAIPAVALAQFVHQVIEVGRWTQGLRTKALLQPFAHGVADRSAGLAIDLLAVIGDSAIHGAFRFVVISNEVTPDQVTGAEIVSSRSAVACFFGKN
jgi:hypothetical protein